MANLPSSAMLNQIRPASGIPPRVTISGSWYYREIEVESRRSLADLAKAIVAAFDFEFDHAFGFYSSARDLMRAKPKFELFADMGEETDAGSVKKTRIKDAFPNVGHTMLFLFDYGHDWRFVVE